MAGAELPGDDMARLKSLQYLDGKRPVHQAACAEVATAQKAVGAAGANRLRAHEALTAIEDGARRAGYIARMEALDAQLVGIPWPGCRHRQAPAPPTAPALYQPQQSGRPPSRGPASAVVRPSHAGRFRFGA
jgi:hypothetical protein